jgi:hypothetical protein
MVIMGDIEEQTHQNKGPAPHRVQRRAFVFLFLSGFRLGFEHLATAVKTGRADVVTQVGLARCGLDCDAWNDQGIVRTVHTALGRGLFVLLDGHDPLLVNALRTPQCVVIWIRE